MRGSLNCVAQSRSLPASGHSVSEVSTGHSSLLSASWLSGKLKVVQPTLKAAKAINSACRGCNRPNGIGSSAPKCPTVSLSALNNPGRGQVGMPELIVMPELSAVVGIGLAALVIVGSQPWGQARLGCFPPVAPSASAIPPDQRNSRCREGDQYDHCVGCHVAVDRQRRNQRAGQFFAGWCARTIAVAASARCAVASSRQ